MPARMPAWPPRKAAPRRPTLPHPQGDTVTRHASCNHEQRNLTLDAIRYPGVDLPAAGEFGNRTAAERPSRYTTDEHLLGRIIAGGLDLHDRSLGGWARGAVR